MPQIHLDPSYIIQTDDNQWTLRRPFVVTTRFRDVLMWDGFVFDKDSIVSNSPDWVPSCTHDCLCRHAVYLDSSPCPRWQADLVYYDLNRNSIEAYNRRVALRRYIGVSIYTFTAFQLGKKTLQPLPQHAKMLAVYYEVHGHLPV